MHGLLKGSRACCDAALLLRRELTVWLDDEEVRRALHAAPVHVTGRFQVRRHQALRDESVTMQAAHGNS